MHPFIYFFLFTDLFSLFPYTCFLRILSNKLHAPKDCLKTCFRNTQVTSLCPYLWSITLTAPLPPNELSLNALKSINLLIPIPLFPVFLYMEELIHPLFNTNPSTSAFNPILFSLLMEFVYIYTPSSKFSTSFLLSNYSETCYWIFYWNKNFSLASPVSFCFIVLLPFSDKLIKADSPYFLPSFHYLSLTLKSTPDWLVPSLLLKDFHAKVSGDHHQKPFGLFSSLSHQ